MLTRLGILGCLQGLVGLTGFQGAGSGTDGKRAGVQVNSSAQPDQSMMLSIASLNVVASASVTALDNDTVAAVSLNLTAAVRVMLLLSCYCCWLRYI